MKIEKCNSRKAGEFRTQDIHVRLTPAEAAFVDEKARSCGMLRSDYIRRVILGYEPKLRMTEEQEAALLRLIDVRSDLIHFRNALNALTQEERLKLFHNLDIMRTWMKAIQEVIEQLKEIIDMFLDSAI